MYLVCYGPRHNVGRPPPCYGNRLDAGLRDLKKKKEKKKKKVNIIHIGHVIV